MELGCKNQFSTRCRTSVRSRTSILALSQPCTGEQNVIFTLFYEHSDLRLLCVVVIWIFDGKRQEQPHVSCLSQFADYIKAPGIQEHRPRGTPEIQGFIECFISCVQSSMTMGACRDVLVSPQSFKNRDVAMTYEQDHGLILNS